MFVVLLPLMIVTAIIVAAVLGMPVLFCQERPGLKGRIFRMYKFRTMRNAVDRNGIPLPDAERMTRLGRILRATSIDELPELLNVLKGDMSLVGPRPLLVEYLDKYTPEQARRHDVRPGITGWAQINGRNSISWEDKFKLDVWYVDNCSFLLDLKILIGTVLAVFKRKGISQANEATMSKFTGSEQSE
jgi:lipopolysaccharide/colanic/teichoic acid biosynthesis glycosyltransferase